MEYYLAIKSNDVLIYVTTWMNLKNIVKWKKSFTKDYILYDSIHMNCSEKATTETEGSLHGCSGLEVGGEINYK